MVIVSSISKVICPAFPLPALKLLTIAPVSIERDRAFRLIPPAFPSISEKLLN